MAGPEDGLEQVWRQEWPYLLAALLRRSADLPSCEDAAQEALLAATQQWPADGIPDNPRGWLIRVASRRLIDAHRSEVTRSAREVATATSEPADAWVAPGADAWVELGAEGSSAPGRGCASDDLSDDTLQLMLLCAHSALTPASRIALTLRAVGGLTTAQIAAGFLVPEATMAQRISRAKATLVKEEARFGSIPPRVLPGRLASVRQVLHLIFNEGYSASSGSELVDADLTGEAIRLARLLHEAMRESSSRGFDKLNRHEGKLSRQPASGNWQGDDGEVAETAGLLSLMLLTHARAASRISEVGDLIPLAEQDRRSWDRELIAEGTALLTTALRDGPVGPFQLQAAIAAVHAEAATWERTDWLQICLLYRMLERIAPGPAVRLNLAIAVGTAHSPAAGLAELQPLLADDSQHRNHRLHAAHAHLLELGGDYTGAATAYQRAASLSTSVPEQRYLNRKLALCTLHAAEWSP